MKKFIIGSLLGLMTCCVGSVALAGGADKMTAKKHSQKSAVVKHKSCTCHSKSCTTKTCKKSACKASVCKSTKASTKTSQAKAKSTHARAETKSHAKAS